MLRLDRPGPGDYASYYSFQLWQQASSSDGTWATERLWSPPSIEKHLCRKCSTYAATVRKEIYTEYNGRVSKLAIQVCAQHLVTCLYNVVIIFA